MQRRRGRVKYYNKKKNYGYIVDINTQEMFFVHRSGLIDEVQADDYVTFELKRTPRGYHAINVRKIT